MSFANGGHSGIVSTADVTQAVYLPLESLAAHIFIADVSARVVLCQEYSHDEKQPLREAYYVFPVPARGAVCSFEMRTDDGRRLNGVVKELAQAKADYEEAVSEGRLAGLLQQFRQDVFVICIGTIPPRTMVTVSIAYVIDLSEDDEVGSVRFQLPFHVGARYGAPPTSALYHGTAQRARLSITADVEMASPIYKVTSISHRVEDVPWSPKSGQSPPDDHFARVKFTSMDTFLETDFLLVVQAPGLEKPRCFAEALSPDDSRATSSCRGLTTALALTIVPRFELPAPPTQEYIFLIDRSGSMHGEDIEMAKDALVVLLRGLPTSGTMFNVVSFGSNFSSLWPRSQRYSGATLHQATHHVENMQADMGGTELYSPLNHIFTTRIRTTPTNVFVLTDGFVYHPQQLLELVRGAVSSATYSPPLRVFALGVGDGASSELCEGLAREGNGAFALTVQGEDLLKKSARLVNAMQVANVKEITVDWGVFNQACQFQSPDRIPALSPGMRLVVTAIFPREQVPTEVALKGRLPDGSLLEYSVPVEALSHRTIPKGLIDASGHPPSPPPLIHTLSAHRFIRDLEEGSSHPSHMQNWVALSPPTRRDVVKALIIELGTRYQVASSHTAFVAIDGPRAEQRPKHPIDPRKSEGGAARSNDQSKDDLSPGKKSSETRSGAHQGGSEEGSERGSGGQSPPHLGGSHTGRSNGQGSPETYRQNGEKRRESSHPGTPSARTHNSTEQRPPSDPQLSGEIKRKNGRANSEASVANRSDSPVMDPPECFAHVPPSDNLEEVFCFPDPVDGDNWVVCTAPPLPQVSVYTSPSRRSFWSRLFRPFQGQVKTKAEESRDRRLLFSSSIFTDKFSSNRLANVSRLQFFDGSFSLTPSLSTVVGVPEDQLRSSIPSSLTSVHDAETIWATVLAVVFFRKKFPLHTAALQEKALQYGLSACARNGLVFDEIIRQAGNLV